MSDEQQAPERDPLVKKFAYEWVCFNHDVNDKYPYLVTDITDDCMIELEGMSGLFAPSCFHLVPAPPTPGADGRYCRHHDDDPAHTKECYKPPADLAPVAQPPIAGIDVSPRVCVKCGHSTNDYAIATAIRANKQQ